MPAESRAGRRPPSVAGVFYPSDAAVLRRKLAEVLPAGPRKPAAAVLAPHAGYDYSGRVAGAAYARVEVTPEVVLLAFHHRGVGARFGIWPGGPWETPLGEAPIARDLADRLKSACPELEEDEGGFTREHSGEVQVPFLQAARPDVRIVPIAVNAWEGGMSGREELARFARSLASAVRGELVVATTDLTHCGEGYGIAPPPGMKPVEWAQAQDRRVLNALERLDIEDFWEAVARRGVTMCGVGPTAVFIGYGRARGASSAEIVAYGTSADDEPDADRAVGYPGVVIW
jgi:hypothetical protein